ncbi:MAG: hypothetical protein KGJ60_00355 [Verrucomicrobiota bacterium]|nr:hypothetical protein [Verrucomicrobiota bacterium]
MDSDEREILSFLKSWGSNFVAAREISRRAGGKRRFHDDPEWAKPALLRLAARGILEMDAMGHFRLIPKFRRGKMARRTPSEEAESAEEGSADTEDAGDVFRGEDYDEP